MLCFYIAYQTQSGTSWRIIDTTLDLDTPQGLKKWIEEEEKARGCAVAPIFWKQLNDD